MIKKYILDAIANNKKVLIYFKDDFDASKSLIINSAIPCDDNCLVVGTGVKELCINLDQVLAVESRQI